MASNLETMNFQEFLGCHVPRVIIESYKEYTSFIGLDRNQIQNLLDFSPPFLRTDKIVIFGDSFVGSRSIGTGLIYLTDVEGHYNRTVYLALAGRLMPSTATIHLAYFFPETSPQAVEGKSIRMDKDAFNNGLIQPKKAGSRFFVETIVEKKKLNLILVKTNIMFGNGKFGLIEELRFVLTPKDSIYKAVEIVDVL